MTKKEMMINEIMNMAIRYVNPYKFFKEEFKEALTMLIETSIATNKIVINENFFIKETIIYNDKPEEKKIQLVGSPLTPTGQQLYYDFSDEQSKEKAFVFCAIPEYLKGYYNEGTFEKTDAHYRKYTLIREFIKTEREETKHEINGWKLEHFGKQRWTKNDIVIEENH